jgi:hypothetical protein
VSNRARRNRLRFAIPLAGEFAYSRFVTGSVIGRDPANPKHRIAGLLDLGIHQDRISTTAGVYLPEAHNGLVKLLLEHRDWDYLVWLEHDHQFDFRMVERMETYREPIVGVRYYTRDAVQPAMMVASFVNQDDPAQTDPPYKIEYLPPSQALKLIAEPGLYPVDFVPHGMTAVRRDVYEKVPYPWYAAGDSKELGDDVYFIAQARKHGYQVYVDSAIYSGHLTLISIDDWWYVRELRRQWLEVQYGHLCPPIFGGRDRSQFLPEGMLEGLAEFESKG